MKISYDPRADAMRIKFQEGEYDSSSEIAEGIVIDMTKDNRIIAIEILDASERMPKKDLKNIKSGVSY